MPRDGSLTLSDIREPSLRLEARGGIIHGHHFSMSNRSKAQSAATMNPAMRIAIWAKSIAAAFSRSITPRSDEMK